MRYLWLTARWGPMAAVLGWFEVSHGEPWYVTACLAAAALARPRTFYLGLPAACAASYLGAPLWLALAAASYRLLYEVPLEGLTTRFVTPPTRPLPLTPRLRCGHVRKGATKRADTDMREGRPASALDRYLRLLADHPAPHTDPCVRVLLARAAEAALRCGCPQIADELAVGALHGLAAQPEGSLAVVAARASALRAQALGELGYWKEAALTLRRAQRVPHRDGPAGELVRTAALGVHFHDTRPGATCDEEQNTAAGLLNEQRLSPGNRRVLIAVHMIIGGRLLRAGHPAEAVKAFLQAEIRTGVHERTCGDDSAFLRWRHRIGPRWRGAVRLWLSAICEQMRGQIANGQQVVGALHEEYEHCVALAPSFEDPLLTARLTAYHLALDPDSPGDERAAVRHLMEYRPFVFADRAAQGNWAALHTEGGTADDLAWWTRTGDRARLLEAVREAEAFFTRLKAVSPGVFGAMHGRAVRTADTLSELLGEPVRRWMPEEPSVTVSPPVPEPAPTPSSTAERIEAVLAGSAKWTWPHPPSSLLPAPDASPARSDRPAPFSSPPPPAPLPQGRFGAPDWLPAAEALIGGPSWMLLTAVAEAHLLGHSRVGAEHLLLAVLDDPLCAALLEPFGAGRTSLRKATAAVLATNPRTPTVATLAGPARTALLDASAEARRYSAAGHHGERMIRPLHLLVALLRQETGIPVSLLASVGVEPREILARAGLWLYADHTTTVGPPERWAPGLPDPRPFTGRARAVLIEAARAACSSGPAALLGLHELSAAVATEGVAPRPVDMPDRPVVRVTHSGRHSLDLAGARARGLGHPGVDLDDLAWAVEKVMSGPGAATAGDDDATLPRWGGAVEAALGSASAAAEADGYPYVAPEHLLATLEVEPRPFPMVPLPLTPLSTRALAVARARAVALKRPECDLDDLRHGLKAAGLRPTADAEPAPAETPPLLTPDFERSMQQGLEQRERESREAATRADVAALRRALRQRTELLRFLALADSRTYEPQLVEALTATAHQLGAGPALDATLRQAASRVRGVRARTPGPTGLLSYARALVEMGTCLRRLDRAGAAAPYFAEAAQALRAGEDEASDSLLGVALLQHARCAVSATPAAAVAPLMEAAGHYLTAAADGERAHRAALPEAALFVIGALSDLNRPEQALAVATRTLRVPGLPQRDLMEVHLRRADLQQVLYAADLGVADTTAAVLLAPDDPYPLVRRGVLLMDLRRWEEALADFDRAADLAPLYPAPRRLRGQVLLRRGDFAEALQVLDDATRNFPDSEPSGDVLWALAAALRATGRVPESLRVARAAYALAPEFPWFRYQYALSLYLAGSVRHSRLHLGGAIRKETQRLRGTARSGVEAGRLAGNLTVYFAALGAARQSRKWLRTALASIHHPWAVAELRGDLDELAGTIPTAVTLCAELVRALDAEETE
ncbi:Clp protease N-terminal domain-containing protein [Streptomyces rhizosphaericola]|uniref:Clp protease N-terminal domain-containing protein n=1 Tax=Streptomyces rhizosphaericola TaxID=2564098 RepID=UPI0036BFE45A